MPENYKNRPVDSEGPPKPPTVIEEEDKKPTLSMAEITAMLEKAELSEKDFENDWGLSAEVYEEIIWALGNIFCEQRPGWHAEITHFELRNDPATPGLDICMSFDKEVGDDVVQQGFEEFREYLLTHSRVLPTDLREKFNVYIGFNYGDMGGIVITKDTIEPIAQETLDSAQDTDIISHGSNYKAVSTFNNLLWRRIRELVT